MIILNNGFQERNNNNQLRSKTIPFDMNSETFEMYASEINSITHVINDETKTYCSLHGVGQGSIGEDKDLIVHLMKQDWNNL